MSEPEFTGFNNLGGYNMMKMSTLTAIFLVVFAVTTAQAVPQGKSAAGKKTTATAKKKAPEINNYISGDIDAIYETITGTIGGDNMTLTYNGETTTYTKNGGSTAVNTGDAYRGYSYKSFLLSVRVKDN